MIWKYLLISFLISFQLAANDTCSRVAQINFQTVLVDTNSTKKGEGLRFHLEKDEKALSYLNKYQENTKLQWRDAVMGTIGSGLLLAGSLSNSEKTTKRTLMITGGTLILVNFLVAKTLEKANEQNLVKAIEEYNRRNLPRIYFSPGSKNSTNNGVRDDRIYLEKGWKF